MARTLPKPSPGKAGRIGTGGVVKRILAMWKATFEDPLHGVSGWLRDLRKAMRYHPERAYMRRRDDGSTDFPRGL